MSGQEPGPGGCVVTDVVAGTRRVVYCQLWCMLLARQPGAGVYAPCDERTCLGSLWGALQSSRLQAADMRLCMWWPAAGKWTVQQAADLGVPAPTIAASLDGRYISSLRDERIAAADFYVKQVGGAAGAAAGSAWLPWPLVMEVH
jgi:hypothetical protein